MIRKVLIANRGEIACRVIRSLNRLGIASVAVYSDVDSRSMHVDLAEEAVLIGPADAAQSYLNQTRIIEAARQTGADAIHPGYGFLSENPDFVRACNDANIVFIGPGADAIEAMGLKDAAKARMEAAGVPVVPGYHGDNQDPDFLEAEAERIGYPVLIKARAGGGGKGMRRVDDPVDFADALGGAQREGKASFGDSRVLIEKFVAAPRHIELQVFGDQHGNVVHLFERDCSLQRRHQKVIEEAPAPGMTESMREAMGRAAVDAAKAVHYVGAGTVEFIVDASDGLREDRFWFMEMNTRLQVEHPITEAITGVDLVEWQLAVADGQPLPLNQEQLSITGHAMEARLYAEDTETGFLPATGTLSCLRFDNEARVDTGVRQGDTISPFYDPMIAKIICHAPTREAAIGQLTRALDNTHIAGCITNRGFLGRLVNHQAFVREHLVTSLIEDHIEALRKPEFPPNAVLAVGALFRAGMLRPASQTRVDQSPWQTLTGWRSWGEMQLAVDMRIDGETRPVVVRQTGNARATITDPNDRHLDVIIEYASGSPRLQIDGHSEEVMYDLADNTLHVFSQGETWQITFADQEMADGQSADGGNLIRAPMPGAVTSLRVGVGDTVTTGDVLAVLEAMKMEHSLRAELDGVVETINVVEGDQVEAGATLITLEADE